MQIRIVRWWHGNEIGSILPDIGGGVAEQLIRRGFAVEHTPESAEPVGAACAPEHDKAIRPAKVKRKGGGQ